MTDRQEYYDIDRKIKEYVVFGTDEKLNELCLALKDTEDYKRLQQNVIKTTSLAYGDDVETGVYTVQKTIYPFLNLYYPLFSQTAKNEAEAQHFFRKFVGYFLAIESDVYRETYDDVDESDNTKDISVDVDENHDVDIDETNNDVSEQNNNNTNDNKDHGNNE